MLREYISRLAGELLRMARLTSTFRHLVVIFGWPVAGLGILLAAGAVLEPVDQLAPAAPMLLVLTIIIAVAAVAVFRFERWRLLLGLGAAMLVTGWIMAPEYFAKARIAAEARSAPAGREIRVLSL